jgi:hypothetical protein
MAFIDFNNQTASAAVSGLFFEVDLSLPGLSIAVLPRDTDSSTAPPHPWVVVDYPSLSGLSDGPGQLMTVRRQRQITNRCLISVNYDIGANKAAGRATDKQRHPHHHHQPQQVSDRETAHGLLIMGCWVMGGATYRAAMNQIRSHGVRAITSSSPTRTAALSPRRSAACGGGNARGYCSQSGECQIISEMALVAELADARHCRVWGCCTVKWTCLLTVPN